MIRTMFGIIQQSQLSLPGLEVVLLITLLSLSLVFRFNRCGMMTAYIFAYRWGWMIVHRFPEEVQFAYIVFGVLVGALSVAGMLADRKSC
jgi:hypothetical protein